MTTTTGGEIPAQAGPPSTETPSAAEELFGRLFSTAIGGLDLICIELGARLGFYRHLADGGRTAAELAQAAGADERYTREWLVQQAVSGLLECDGDDPATARYALPEGTAQLFLDETSPMYLRPLFSLFPIVNGMLPRLEQAYRTGAGVPYQEYGRDAVSAQAAINRPAFEHLLTQAWLPSMPDVDARLRDATRPAHVADVGCGAGWSAIRIALAYPTVTVDGIDDDATSIQTARRNAADAGVADRVTFEVQDAADGWSRDGYDLVTFFECLHDMPHPARALQRAREALARGGTVLVVDERTAESFTAPGDELERFFAGASVTWCLPQSRTAPDSAALGTLLRPATLRRLAAEAGFRDVDVLDIDFPFWRFYRLRT